MPTDYGSLEAFEARLRDRIAAHAADASGNCRTLPERGEINLVAEQLAKEMGLWIPYPQAMNMGVPAPSGMENDVYFDANSNSIVKINNLMVSRDVLSLLERLQMHNVLFPQTAYSLEGFTGFGRGSIYPVLRQAYVANATYATHGEILDYMESLGFTLCGEAAFTNGEVTITDVRPRNVLKDNNGAIFVIDVDFILSK